MTTTAKTERGLLVFTIWASVGVLGLGFVLEGFARDSLVPALIGIGLVVLAFTAHIVINAIWRQGFTQGEAALGIAAYGVLALVFVVAWLAGRVSASGYVAGISLFGLLAAGLIAYLATRYGLRGAFSRFHVHVPDPGEQAR